MLAIFFLTLVPANIDLISLALEVRKSTLADRSRKVMHAITRLIVICSFAMILSPIAIYMLSSSTISKKSDRLFNSYSRDQVYQYYQKLQPNAETVQYQSSHITVTLFLYSIIGIIISVPFTIRKDFLRYYGLSSKKQKQQLYAVEDKKKDPSNSNSSNVLRTGEKKSVSDVQK